MSCALPPGLLFLWFHPSIDRPGEAAHAQEYRIGSGPYAVRVGQRATVATVATLGDTTAYVPNVNEVAPATRSHRLISV